MSAQQPIVEIKHLAKSFAGGVTAVDAVSLDIESGEFFALLGPSGCGKTTLLRMIAGLEVPSAGEVLIDGQSMTGIAPNRRPVNMVFQSYAVFPHMSVFDNVGYGLKVTGTAAAEIATRVNEALDLVRLAGLQQRKPDQLSGGQRQRVALARALVKRPKVLLLDEPLSALDAKLREAMQLELVKLQHAVGITFVVVTHDQDEALSMADRIAVMDQGAVRQIAPPSELYEFPSSRFVAEFIGKMNLFEARVIGYADSILRLAIEGIGELTVPAAEHATGNIGIAVRPEKIKLLQQQPTDDSVAVAATVSNVAYHGSESHIFADTDNGIALTATVQNSSRQAITPTKGERVWLGWAPLDTLVLRD